MPSHFRLLQATEAALHHGSLEGIDALLGITFDYVRILVCVCVRVRVCTHVCV